MSKLVSKTHLNIRQSFRTLVFLNTLTQSTPTFLDYPADDLTYQAYMSTYHYLFKFIVIGDTGVGKSCVVLQFIQNKTRASHDVTIGVEFGAKTIKINNKNIKLQIWDTAGQENFRSITRSYYRSAIGALLVYDITRRETFDHLKEWLEEVRSNGNPYMEILLVANKSDLEEQRVVSTDEGSNFAKENNISFIEISAKQYTKVAQAFNIVASTIFKKVQEGKLPLHTQNIGIKVGEEGGTDYTLDPTKNANKNKKNCCAG